MSTRTQMLKERLLSTTPEICVERACLITESCKETEGEPPIIRRAKAFQRILEEMTIFVEDGQLIVGNLASQRRVKQWGHILNNKYSLLYLKVKGLKS